MRALAEIWSHLRTLQVLSVADKNNREIYFKLLFKIKKGYSLPRYYDGAFHDDFIAI